MKHRKAANMFAPTNPENERIRAQSILRSFTEYDEAVELFAPKSAQSEVTEPAATTTQNNEHLMTRVFNAVKRERRSGTAGAAQQPVYSPRRVTTTGC
ncbi:MAG TPA: hypothetical protein PKD09_17740 [Aggregatilinea sp.]|jgi:hypothetical protein|uniref:hypothetical protein n=1 Tax=Aggregatilinea sp. TaxID=2806333 RepID=UPI002BB4FCA7|nr:hypothetical protein [Aggregatilinea sp.]HML23503.1 hypothetical protein [Aggregatilinea sp.]